jgi:hypothetical protein
MKRKMTDLALGVWWGFLGIVGSWTTAPLASSASMAAMAMAPRPEPAPRRRARRVHSVWLWDMALIDVEEFTGAEEREAEIVERVVLS